MQRDLTGGGANVCLLRRHEKAPVSTRIWALIHVLSAPLVATVASVLLLARGSPTPVIQVSRAFVFCSITLAMLRRYVHWRAQLSLSVLVAGAAAVVLPVGVVLVATSQRLPMGGSAESVLVAVLAGAAAEETIFRGVLPRGLVLAAGGGSATRGACCSSLVAPQLLFALCHFVVALMAPASPALARRDFLSLTAAGALLQVIQLNAGVGAAIGAHAAINYSLLSAESNLVPFPEGATAITAAVSLAGLCALSRRSASAWPRVRHLRRPPTGSW
jgi:membrane protease YdiL (CAAX protease family)